MGSLVRVSNGARHGVPTFTLVDGQQRLTTISLLLRAIYVVLEEDDPDTARKVWRMLINPDEKEASPSRYKLVPTGKHGDRETFIAAMTGASMPDVRSGISGAYAYLLADIRAKVSAGEVDPRELYQTILTCFQVVTIDLKQDEQPYKIFESLNGKGKPLTPADLVRNYVAMTLPYALQEEMFTKHWAFIDDALQERREVGNSGYGELTGFLRHYLAMRTGKLYNREHIYERFRDRAKRDFPTGDSFAAEITTLHQFATYYDRFLRPEREPNSQVRDALERLQTFDVSTAFPFIMRAYDARNQGDITPEQFLDMLGVLENYVVRRFLCGKQTNYTNQMFPTLWEEIQYSKFALSLRERLATKQFPSDEEVRQAVRTRKMYSQRYARRLTLIFQAVNRRLSVGSGGYTVLDADPTFEHILPQSPMQWWRLHLGENWEEMVADYVHTLGNLTPVTQGWNSSLSNRSFPEKRERLRGSGLRLNSEYFAQQIERWDETAIIARADWLTDNILALWPSLGQPKYIRTPATKPRSVTFMSSTLTTTQWSSVFIFTANSIATYMGAEFAAYAGKFPHLFFKEKPESGRTYHSLSNGWWLCTHWNHIYIKKYCLELALAAGFSESDWTVEEAS